MRHVRKIPVSRQLQQCPACGYTDGFHVMFARTSTAKKHFRLLLVCPMCSDIFDMGLKVEAPDKG